jgi:predicted nuclease of predicted toxin-antitoxin system
VRLLVDECVLGPIVAQLRIAGHDVADVPVSLRGADDETILARSVSENRVLLTQDYDFGDLAFKLRKRAVGIVIVARSSFSGTLEEVAAQVVERLGQLGDATEGKLTVLEAHRSRQREF